MPKTYFNNFTLEDSPKETNKNKIKHGRRYERKNTNMPIVVVRKKYEHADRCRRRYHASNIGFE